MAAPTTRAGLHLTHLLLAVTAIELALNRLVTHELRSIGDGDALWWHTAVDHAALFSHYFASTLAVGLVVRAFLRLLRRDDDWSGIWRWGIALATCTLVIAGAINITSSPSSYGSFVFESGFVALVLVIAMGQWTRPGPLGLKLGIVGIAIPLIIPFYGPLSAQLWAGEEVLWGDGAETVHRIGQWAMVLLALISPYFFAPRPLVHAASRLAPAAGALIVGVVGLFILRNFYEVGMRMAHHGLGIDIGPGAPAEFLALYLLALSTMAWTVIACVGAESAARRDIGVGLGLFVMAGYGFSWPIQYLVGTVGLLTLSDAATRLREQEGERHATGFPLPPIADSVWHEYVTHVAGLVARTADVVQIERLLGTRHLGGEALTRLSAREPERVETDHISAQVPVQGGQLQLDLYVQRVDGAVSMLEIICAPRGGTTRAPSLGDAVVERIDKAGRKQIDWQEPWMPRWTLYAFPEKLLGIGAHPEPPPCSGPVCKVDDAAFSERFRLRDAGGLSERLLDAGLRARASALVDGWIGFWSHGRLQYRLHPGQGAPLDHPIPVTELAFRGAGSSRSAERLATLVELLVDIATRGLPSDVHAPDGVMRGPRSMSHNQR